MEGAPLLARVRGAVWPMATVAQELTRKPPPARVPIRAVTLDLTRSRPPSIPPPRGGLQQRRRVRCPSSLARLDWPLRTPGPAIVIVSPPAKHQPHPPQPPLTTSNPTNLRTARNKRNYQLGKGRKVHLRTASPTTPPQPKIPPICTGGDNTSCDTDDDDDEAIPPQSTSNPEHNPSSPNSTATRPDVSGTLRP
ncbi:hypothetical protein CCHR01_06636 [Colletotrichum chrysophilum]|uniref:Uncharacterized protein n=1 Tax=Colletotrichum chrysophilum TaxID=1836956 RepID=A0AAD9AQB4_9PEZI|nr:hypothetical protein CCHR01_06636 [Colletotrichum chrysophilum]